MQRIFNFSVKPSDNSSMKLVNEIKLISIKKGINFSFICIEGLKLYKQHVLDKKENASE